MEPLEVVLEYHRETKHHLSGYARSLGYLDWASQPDPFRRFHGSRLVPLPILDAEEEPRSPRYEEVYCPSAVPCAPLSVRSLSRLFEYALALSAWKEAGGARWALRSNPSSGNLHPTEGYLWIGSAAKPTLAPGLYHYAPKEHGLEQRAEIQVGLFAALMQDFPRGAFLVGLSSVYWREAWKYGERAFRYCQHDAGHAIGAIRIAAAALGWRAVILDEIADQTIEALLGLDRAGDFEGAEREQPELVMVVWPEEGASGGAAEAGRSVPLNLDPEHVENLTKERWFGKANRLSASDPVPWEIIDRVAAASRRLSGGRGSLVVAAPAKAQPEAPGGPLAGQIIRQRRSLQACDGETPISSETFYRMLSRVMPRADGEVSLVPWDGLPWEPAIHLALFVHRVVGVPPGLYLLPRRPAAEALLRNTLRREFSWTTLSGCPAGLPLYLLAEGDVQRLATRVSCHQEIAGDGAFSLGMIAEFEPALRARGSWFYRRLYWEAGVVGQVLYLEAEAAGVRATGIGCYFDDAVHQVFGLREAAFQSLYHFTVGTAIDDPRLTTLPPYPASRRVGGGGHASGLKSP